VQPQREYLRGYGAWITGIRRDQTSTRRQTPAIAWDAKFELAKIAPLVTWSEQDVWDYVVDHDIPTNSLHGLGYPSIGCTHCTRPVQAGEDPRAGRWSGTLKTECGLHVAPEQRSA
jgi:phosphoadenosine phosphosulfate reductase